MFTGLIEEVGSVTAIGASKNGNQLKIAAPRIAKKIRRGDSLAANHLPAEWHRLSIGNRVTGGICPLCRVQGLDCRQWDQSDRCRDFSEKLRRVDYSLHEKAHEPESGPPR